MMMFSLSSAGKPLTVFVVCLSAVADWQPVLAATKEAEKLFMQVMETRKAKLGANHP